MSCVFANREDWEVLHQDINLTVDVLRQHIQASTTLSVLPHDVSARESATESERNRRPRPQ